MPALIEAMDMRSEQNSKRLLKCLPAGSRLLKCLPAGRHESKRLLGLYQQTQQEPRADQMQQLFEALDKLCVSTCVQCGVSVNACSNQSIAVCHSCLLNGESNSVAASFDWFRSHDELAQSNDSVSSLSSPARSYICESPDDDDSKIANVTKTIQDVLQSSPELLETVEDEAQTATDVVASDETSEEQQPWPLLPETGRHFASVAAALQFSELLIALDPSLRQPSLAEKASDQELPEASAGIDASALHFAGADVRPEHMHCLNNGTRQVSQQARKASHAVAALVPSALQGLKRAVSLAQKAKERVQKTSGDMIDVELSYVPV
jgi:hypothetical protein